MHAECVGHAIHEIEQGDSVTVNVAANRDVF
jgi:hypothetical protein